MEIIQLFTTQLLLPLVSEFYSVGLLAFYGSDSTLLFGEEEILFLRGESELGLPGKLRRYWTATMVERSS